jgi:hypothetical protein
MALTGAPPAGDRRLSELLVDLAGRAGQRISLGTLADTIGERSFAALMILFAAPNLIPMPPGASTVFGIPLLLVAAQLALGRPRVWLPEVMSRRSVDRTTFAAIARRMQPVLRRFESVARPRLWPSALAERWVGVVVVVLAIVLILPIPLGNWLPALAVILISFGLAERDGVWIAGGSLAAVVALGFVAAIIGSIGYALRWLIG